MADGTLLEFSPSFLDFSTVSTFIIFSMDPSEYITHRFFVMGFKSLGFRWVLEFCQPSKQPG